MPTVYTPATEPADTAAGDLIDGPFQIELRGIVMDACDPRADLVISSWFEGLGVPPTRNDDKLRPQAHGAYASPQYLSERVLTWSVVPRGASAAEALVQAQYLGQAMAPVLDTDSDLVVPLYFTLADSTEKYVVWGKPGRAAFDYANYLRTNRRATGPYGVLGSPAVCEFICPDPRIYGELTTGSMSLGSSSGGWDVGGWAFPFAFGSASPGSAAITNSGNIKSYPVMTITAGGSGLSGITITNNATGEQWSISLTMAAADVLVVDMLNHTALLNGASRANVVIRPPSVWFGIDPGSTVVSWTATGAGSTMDVALRPAWLF